VNSRARTANKLETLKMCAKIILLILILIIRCHSLPVHTSSEEKEGEEDKDTETFFPIEFFPLEEEVSD